MTPSEALTAILSSNAATALISVLAGQRVARAKAQRVQVNTDNAREHLTRTSIDNAHEVIDLLRSDIQDLRNQTASLRAQNQEQQKQLDDCLSDRQMLHQEVDDLRAKVAVFQSLKGA